MQASRTKFASLLGEKNRAAFRLEWRNIRVERVRSAHIADVDADDQQSARCFELCNALFRARAVFLKRHVDATELGAVSTQTNNHPLEGFGMLPFRSKVQGCTEWHPIERDEEISRSGRLDRRTRHTP